MAVTLHLGYWFTNVSLSAIMSLCALPPDIANGSNSLVPEYFKLSGVVIFEYGI